MKSSHVSDDERDDDAPAELAPRPKKKKKKHKAIAVARSAALAREPMAPPAPSWTTAHLGGALAVGLALGALGGYGMWGRGAGSEAAPSKDSPSATSSSRTGMMPTGRPQQPQEPATPVYIALAPHSPREGPEHAKVTIVEFSDFQ